MALLSSALTPRVAADLKNVSPRYVEKLMNIGKIEGVESSLSERVRLLTAIRLRPAKRGCRVLIWKPAGGEVKEARRGRVFEGRGTEHH
jgi:hypothetical protein